MIRITIALLLLLAVPANAQDSIPRSGWGASFHDAVGRVTGSACMDSNGVTTSRCRRPRHRHRPRR
jgi:hypothetical protein